MSHPHTLLPRSLQAQLLQRYPKINGLLKKCEQFLVFQIINIHDEFDYVIFFQTDQVIEVMEFMDELFPAVLGNLNDNTTVVSHISRSMGTTLIVVCQ